MPLWQSCRTLMGTLCGYWGTKDGLWEPEAPSGRAKEARQRERGHHGIKAHLPLAKVLLSLALQIECFGSKSFFPEISLLRKGSPHLRYVVSVLLFGSVWTEKCMLSFVMENYLRIKGRERRDEGEGDSKMAQVWVCWGGNKRRRTSWNLSHSRTGELQSRSSLTAVFSLHSPPLTPPLRLHSDYITDALSSFIAPHVFPE